MAVDYKGQPITKQTAFTTTGMMNRKPMPIKPLKMPTAKDVEQKATQQRVVEKEKPQIDLSNLRDDDKRILNIHLTPSLKNVFNKVFGQDIFPEFGIKENTVSIPTSIIVDRFGSLSNFRSMVQRDANNNVPPSQGIMTSPQTMKV
jgi:hypothetical protein|tara:strand:- start:248 stop:685 length:438 start_codon:yes stop_codon:yes gene_type:complete